jgi:hypothetical protein
MVQGINATNTQMNCSISIGAIAARTATEYNKPSWYSYMKKGREQVALVFHQPLNAAGVGGSHSQADTVPERLQTDATGVWPASGDR